MSNHIGIDLGAESGRVVAGQFDGYRLSLTELHRFETGAKVDGETLRWDVERFWQEILAGLASAIKLDPTPESVGVDTWGVDYVLLDREFKTVEPPWHYRDTRTNHAFESAFKLVPRSEIYERTGIQFLSFNTLFQLLVSNQSAALAAAEHLLTIPDYFHWLLSGKLVNEFTNATTTQCFSPKLMDWDETLLKKFGIRRSLFSTVIQPGTELGTVQNCPELAETKVILPASHDTGSAVCAAPVDEGVDQWAFISSGTWSLVGIELYSPVINDQTLNLNITNEGGVEGTWRMLKNVMGLWLVQGIRNSLIRKGETFSYAELTEWAAQSKPFVSLVDPDNQQFLSPPDMLAAVNDFCKNSGQLPPADAGAAVRCVLESLALKYNHVLQILKNVSHRNVEVVHVVGGGSQNDLLNQFVADACDINVVAGPVEATIVGNIMMQCKSLGKVDSLSELRSVVRNSFDLAKFSPEQNLDWSSQRKRFNELVGRSESCAL